MLFATARLDHPDLAAASAASEGDQLAGRTPYWRFIISAAEGDPPLHRSVGIHHVKLWCARTVAFEHDLASVGGEAGACVDARGGRQPSSRTAVRIGHIDVAVRTAHHRKGDLPAVG